MKIKTPALLILLLAAAGFSSAAPNKDKDKEAVAAAAARFYVALNQMFAGDITQMKDVWSHADDVAYMGPDGGLKIGWPQILKDWEKNAALKMGGKVQPAGMQITVGQTLAFTSNYENGENTDSKGALQKVSIRATNIFRKESGRWKMVGHHTDLLPFLAK